MKVQEMVRSHGLNRFYKSIDLRKILLRCSQDIIEWGLHVSTEMKV